MENLSIIPARGGSKGILGKNLSFIAGKPLIAHTIQSASQARLVNRVIVSTDCTDIGRVAQEYGAEVVWRPAELSGDTESSESALLHVLEYLEETENYKPDLTVFLQCTSPLTTSSDIDGTVQALCDEEADSAFAAVPFHYFLWRKGTEGGMEGVNHDKRVRPLRQEREPEYLETGAVYVMRTDGFKQSRHRFFGKTAIHLIPEERCWEIDEPFDLVIAELLLREQQRQSSLSAFPSKLAGVILDFDGVFTDNRVIVFQDGSEAVLCSRSDGWGLAELKAIGIPIAVISTEKNPVVAARCRKLGIECAHDVGDKLAVLKQWATEQSIDLRDVIYLGNDVNDIDCLQAVGCPVVVADSYPDLMKYAKIMLKARGGEGAIRELCDLIVKKLKG